MAHVSSDIQWLAERSEAEGYVVVVVLVLFSGWGGFGSYVFACPPEPSGMSTILVAAQSVGYRGKGEKGKLVKIVRKCNEYRG